MNLNSRNYNPLHRWRSSRVATSPVSYECILETTLSFGENQLIIFGRILNAYVEDRFVLDAKQALIDTPASRWSTRCMERNGIRECQTFSRWTGRPGKNGSDVAKCAEAYFNPSFRLRCPSVRNLKALSLMKPAASR